MKTVAREKRTRSNVDSFNITHNQKSKKFEVRIVFENADAEVIIFNMAKWNVRENMWFRLAESVDGLVEVEAYVTAAEVAIISQEIDKLTRIDSQYYEGEAKDCLINGSLSLSSIIGEEQ